MQNGRRKRAPKNDRGLMSFANTKGIAESIDKELVEFHEQILPVFVEADH